MSTIQDNLFTLNGAQYDSNHLPTDGKQIYGLLNEAQNEMKKLETRKALLIAAQQHLINQLKPLLPAPIVSQTQDAGITMGRTSTEIPTSPTEKPVKEPVPLPDNLPEMIKSKKS